MPPRTCLSLEFEISRFHRDPARRDSCRFSSRRRKSNEAYYSVAEAVAAPRSMSGTLVSLPPPPSRTRRSRLPPGPRKSTLPQCSRIPFWQRFSTAAV